MPIFTLKSTCAYLWLFAIIGIGCAQAAPRDFETTRLGRHILNLSGRTFMSTENACSLPPQPTNGNWEHHPLIRGGGEFCLFSVGILMEEGTHLLYTCDPGYRLEGRPVVRCMRRRWTAIPSCIRSVEDGTTASISIATTTADGLN